MQSRKIADELIAKHNSRSRLSLSLSNSHSSLADDDIVAQWLTCQKVYLPLVCRLCLFSLSLYATPPLSKLFLNPESVGEVV